MILVSFRVGQSEQNMAYDTQLVSIPRAGFENLIMELKIESRRPGQWSIHGSRREVNDVGAGGVMRDEKVVILGVQSVSSYRSRQEDNKIYAQPVSLTANP